MGKTGSHKRYAMNNRSTRDLYYKARELSPKPMEGIDDDKFFRVVSGMNRLIAEEIENGQTVDFPCAMGKVFIKKFDMKPRIGDDGKLLVPSYIDWKATLKSWKEDPELQKERITINIRFIHFIELYMTRHIQRIPTRCTSDLCLPGV